MQLLQRCVFVFVKSAALRRTVEGEKTGAAEYLEEALRPGLFPDVFGVSLVGRGWAKSRAQECMRLVMFGHGTSPYINSEKANFGERICILIMRKSMFEISINHVAVDHCLTRRSRKLLLRCAPVYFQLELSIPIVTPGNNTKFQIPCPSVLEEYL
jgi:hypothetical protein